jgi:1-deoxy-D-xylulose-5-phosphate synthase
VVSSPMNEEELRNLMYTGSLYGGPFSIRYPRGNGVMPNWKTPFQQIPVGQGRRIKAGEEVAILTIGHIGNYAVGACESLEKEGLNPAHYDMRFVKPLDEKLLHEIFTNFKKVITVEDGCLMGGFGSAVLEFMADRGYKAEVVRLGIPDEYIHHGTQNELWAACGFDAASIAASVERLLMVENTKTASSQAG